LDGSMLETFMAFLQNFESVFIPDNSLGLLALFILAVITDIGIPVPFVLDTLLILAAYQSGPFSIQVLTIVGVLFLGRQVGSGILYFLALLMGGKFIRWLKRCVPWVGNKMDSLGDRLHNVAPLAVVTGRLTPGLLQITSVAAGTMKLRYDRFFIGVALASLVYDAILILLGFIARNGVKSDDPNFTMWSLIMVVVVVCLLWPLTGYLIQRNNKKVAANHQKS
jgi:membrane protein DedA with SNARE-associated domain